ncbi:MAG: hypothetical protein DWG76_01295 [Chloroflexi bacterium]|nr:hypothetical protein [Chloroflexota bacterium]
MISGRVAGWFELIFWRLAVRVLSVARPVQRSLLAARLAHLERQQSIRHISHPFENNLITAIAGWGLGLLLGYALMHWWF